MWQITDDELESESIADETNMMRVQKRDGHHEPVDVNKIVKAVQRLC